jgi:hypothetical protein
MSTYGFNIEVSGGAIKSISQINGQLSTMEKKGSQAVNSLGSGFKGLLKQVGGLAIGFMGAYKAFELIQDSVKEYHELEAAITKVNTTLESSGNVIGTTSDELVAMAGDLSSKILPEESKIIEAQSMLLMFKSIAKDTFKDVLPLSADFAAKFGMDMPDAARLLGRSLENLDLGRLGVKIGKLSAAQEKSIKHFKETGQVAKAQAVIMDFVASKVGGTAEAMAGTDAGQLEMAAKNWHEIKIAIGQIVVSLQKALIPLFNKMAEIIKKFIGWLKSGSIGAEIFKYAVGALVAVLAAVGIGMGIATAATWLFNAALWANPITWIVAGVIALVAAIMILWDKCEGFRVAVGSIFAAIAKYVMGLVHYFMNLGKILKDVFTLNWDDLKTDSQKFIKDFGNDFVKGWGEAVKTGGEKAGKSTFKFGDILGKAKKEAGLGGNKDVQNAIAKSAINTSALSGASGGLGEAKVINIRIDTMQKIEIPGGNGKDVIARSPSAIEQLTRALNNIAYNQSGVM